MDKEDNLNINQPDQEEFKVGPTITIWDEKQRVPPMPEKSTQNV